MVEKPHSRCRPVEPGSGEQKALCARPRGDAYWAVLADRAIRAEAWAEAQHVKSVRRIEREFAEAERERATWRRRFRVIRERDWGDETRQQQQRNVMHHVTRRPLRQLRLPAYLRPLTDKEGRQFVFQRIRYYAAKKTRQGHVRERACYIIDGAHVSPAGERCVASNLGVTDGEILEGFDVLELTNRTAAANAKTAFHGIMQHCHLLTPEQQFEAARCYAENTFGRQGLPYLVVLHPPSEDGDQRNWHVHILFSFRPMERIAEGQWEIGRYLRTDLDSPEQFARLRYLWSEQLNHACERAGEAYYDGGKQRCLLASKAWQDAPSNNQNQRLRLAARAKRLRDSLGFSPPLPQALADKLEQDAKEHDRRLLAAKAAAAAAGSSDTGGSPSSIAPQLSAEAPAPSPRRQQRSVGPESAAENGEPHEELIAKFESTPGLSMARKQGKLVPALGKQEEGGGLSANFDHPDIQSALEQERRRQWQFVREVWGVLTKSVTKSDVDGGSAAVIKALPDDQRHKASPWAETPIWGLMLRQLEKSGKRRSEAAVRLWEEARRNKEHSLPAIAANVAARLKRWPIQIAPETEAAIKQDVARHAAQIAAQQNMLGR